MDLLLARGQMGLSLAFHIIFAAVGIAMPVLMVASEAMWLKTRDRDYLTLAHRWAKGTAVLFAIGAVSGTVLSFELGLLFPKFMKHAGPIIGMPFSLEGFAFFTEAIFLGIYLYGWEKVAPRLHLAAGCVVAISGLASALFVTIANAWMNAPTGFRFENGNYVDIDPVAAMLSPYAANEIIHTSLASYVATALAVAGIHALGILRGHYPLFHQKALGLALWVALPCALVQPIVGHMAGQQVARYQPLKLAALEGLMHTQSQAPLSIGPLHIPGGLSLMAYDDADAVVQGLSDFPTSDWPHPIVRYCFLVMVILGTLQAAFAFVSLFQRWRKKLWPEQRSWLWGILLLSPTGIIAMEAGWFVTEMGRQPWIIYGYMRTHDAVTPMPGLIVPFTLFSLLYLAMGLLVITILWRHIRSTLSHNRTGVLS